jgi:hypothetical protein
VSDDFTRLIPRDPLFVPTAEAQRRALRLLRKIAPKADEVTASVSDEVQFVDCGSNWDGVRCPHCRATLDDWWNTAFEAASESEFTKLDFKLPCCRKRTALPELDYVWPVGFARFVLEARNARLGGKISKRRLAELERVLGCTILVVRAHY